MLMSCDPLASLLPSPPVTRPPRTSFLHPCPTGNLQLLCQCGLAVCGLSCLRIYSNCNRDDYHAFQIAAMDSPKIIASFAQPIAPAASEPHPDPHQLAERIIHDRAPCKEFAEQRYDCFCKKFDALAQACTRIEHQLRCTQDWHQGMFARIDVRLLAMETKLESLHSDVRRMSFQKAM